MKCDNNRFKYEYVDVPPSGNQYEDVLTSGFGKRTDARYIHSCIAPGNPFVEALPRYRMTDQVIYAYNEPISVPKPEEVQKMDMYNKMESISQLYDLRIPFPFHVDIEREFHNALVQSYRNRMVMEDGSVNLPYTSDNTEKITHQKLIAKNMSASVTGFSLLGVSGCGKSSGINKLLENYPQVITHHPKDRPPFQQIVYLMVVCPPASNFKVLFNEIGRQIDLSLGNMIPTYQRYIEKAKTVGEKSARVAELIELFSIGIILFDEIQQVDMSSTKENSIESLLTLNNTTNIAIAVIGTEEAYKKMFQKRRVARRLGVYIEASKYCENRKTFDWIVNTLFQYSWTTEPVQPSDDVLDAIYEITDGVIDQMISLYAYLQFDLVKMCESAQKKKKIKSVRIDESLIRETASRHALEIKQSHKINQNSEYSQALSEMMNTARQLEEQEETMKDFEKKLLGEVEKRNLLMQQVIIERLSPKYPKARIKQMTQKLLNSKSNDDLSIDEAVDLVSNMINDAMKKDSSKSKKPNQTEIHEYITPVNSDSADVFTGNTEKAV